MPVDSVTVSPGHGFAPAVWDVLIPSARSAFPQLAPLLDELLAHPDASRREAARLVARLALRMAERKGESPDARLSRDVGDAAWASFLAGWSEWRLTREFARSTAVVANAVALIALADVQDFVDYAALAGRIGEAGHADLIHDRLLELDSPALPLQTALMTALCSRGLGDRLRDELPAAQALEVAEVCGRSGVWLLRAGDESVDRDAARPIESADDVRRLAGSGIIAWRRHYWAFLEHPWSAEGDNLAREALAVEDKEIGREALWWLGLLRRHAEEQERAAVTRRIKRLIEDSGLSQRDFAARIGTSPSRLSTYATGKVVPSATLLLRMVRVAARAERGDL